MPDAVNDHTNYVQGYMGVSDWHPNWGTYVGATDTLTWNDYFIAELQFDPANWSGTVQYMVDFWVSWDLTNQPPTNPVVHDWFQSFVDDLNPQYSAAFSGTATPGGGRQGRGQQWLAVPSQCWMASPGAGCDASVHSAWWGRWTVLYQYIPGTAWQGNTNSYSNAGNWTNGLPNGGMPIAYFGAVTGSRSVTMDSAGDWNLLHFDSADSYTISGPETITLYDDPPAAEGDVALAQVAVSAGTHTISAPLHINNDTAFTIDAADGALTLSGAVTVANGVTISKSGDGTLTFSNLVLGDAAGKTATFNHGDGPVTVSGTLAVGSNGGTGTYILNSGVLTAGTITNNGTFNYYGGEVHGNLTNNGTLTVDNPDPLTVYGNILNDGTIKVNHTTLNYTGTFTNNGTYNSDPADNHFVDLLVGPGGILLGGKRDRFFIAGSLLSSSENSAGWDTREAELRFIGGGGKSSHTLSVLGADLGPTAAGFEHNFAWGSLVLASGQSLVLQDGNATSGGAIYVRKLVLPAVDEEVRFITGNGLKIYYDSNTPEDAYLGGKTYRLKGGGIIAPIAAHDKGNLLYK